MCFNGSPHAIPSLTDASRGLKIKIDKNPINFMDSAKHVAGQLSEFIVLLEVRCVGNFSSGHWKDWLEA